MDLLPAAVTPAALLFALAVTLCAGLVKGLTGFAMPMVMISGLSLILPPETALAALIVPTLLTNLLQALRQGWGAARAAILRFRVFLLAMLALLLVSAQLVSVLSAQALYLLIGLPVVAFGLLQLSGWAPRLHGRSVVTEALVGGFSGFVGGVSAVWGPPTVAYLTAIDLPKTEHVRVQGVIYAAGSIALLGAHLRSGVLSAETLPLSLLMVPPALIGMFAGRSVLDRIDQRAFRRAVLAVLILAGLNLVRRGLWG